MNELAIARTAVVVALALAVIGVGLGLFATIQAANLRGENYDLQTRVIEAHADADEAYALGWMRGYEAALNEQHADAVAPTAGPPLEED